MNTADSNPSSDRIISIDIVRGIVLLLMGFGHITYFLGALSLFEVPVHLIPPYAFFHHWIGLICPFVFIFLAGISIYFYQMKYPGLSKLSRRLIIRGFWLILLELTVVHFSWFFGSYNWFILQICWLLGWSMIALAGLIWLPRWLIGVIVVLTFAGHNLLDSINASDLGRWDWLWAILHEKYQIRVNKGFIGGFKVLYPLIPWVSVMAAGYVCAPLYLKPQQRRQFLMKIWGSVLILSFIILRFFNSYGESKIWSVQDDGLLTTIMSFLDITRYPPSLLYLLITFGITLWLLSLMEWTSGKLAQILATFGRVPLFFYLIHMFVINGAITLWSRLQYSRPGGWWWDRTATVWPPGYQFNIYVAWTVWIVFTLLMYILCQWYADIKKRRQYWWLKYL